MPNPDTIRHLRARALAGLPLPLRRMLRRSRDRIQRIESRVRGRLPERWGGPPAAVHLVGRRLRETDRQLLEALRPFEQAKGDDVDAIGGLEDAARFVYGVFAHQQLVAAGYCIGLGAATAPFAAALFAADYVHPAFRRRGLSHALHAGRVRELRRLCCRRVFAWVEPENAASRAGLRASGFAAVSNDPAFGLTPASARHRLMLCELE